MKKHKNILVVQTAFPGDIILTTPLFKGVKKVFPESNLSVVTTPQGCELLKETKEIDTLIPYDKRGGDRGILKAVALARKLRGDGFDLCISPHRSLRTSLMVLGTGIRERIGFSDAALATTYTKRVFRDKSLHEVERVLSLLDPLGAGKGELDKSPYLELSPDAIKRVENLIDEAGISPGNPLIGVAPGSVWPTKRWTVDGYASLIDRLTETFDTGVLLLGSSSDREVGDEIINLCRHKPADLVGKTTLGELVAAVDRCRLLIGNDSAPGHVAAARGVPVISIFGPTVPSFGYYPYGKNVTIVESDLPCRPCHHHGPKKCPEGHFRCMRDISSDDVIKHAEAFLR